MHYLLIYEVVPDYVNRREAFREAHLALASAAVKRGELTLGGAVGDPVDGALFVFRCDTAAVPNAFATPDPYVLNGLVTRWRVQPWHTVDGLATSPP